MYAYIFSTEERMKWKWFHNPDPTLSSLNICYCDDEKHEFSLKSRQIIVMLSKFQYCMGMSFSTCPENTPSDFCKTSVVIISLLLNLSFVVL